MFVYGRLMFTSNMVKRRALTNVNVCLLRFVRKKRKWNQSAQLWGKPSLFTTFFSCAACLGLWPSPYGVAASHLQVFGFNLLFKYTACNKACNARPMKRKQPFLMRLHVRTDLQQTYFHKGQVHQTVITRSLHAKSRSSFWKHFFFHSSKLFHSLLAPFVTLLQ